MLNYAMPVIEWLATSEVVIDDDAISLQVQKRRLIAQAISDYFSGKGKRMAYYYALRRLLRSPEYYRLALYLPFSDLENAPEWFREVYLDDWYDLLNLHDARENFFEGDTYEVDARPNGELERVVKCAHLTPWLVKAGYIDYPDLKEILELNQDNEVLLRSFANTWRLMDERKILSPEKMRNLKRLTEHVAQRAEIKPLYNSKNRQKWLYEREKSLPHEELLTPNAKLAGPFLPNITAFLTELEEIQAKLDPNEIALVGGSRLKGYGTASSDLDVYRLRDLEADPEMQAGSPHAASIYLTAIWLGGNQVCDLEEIAIVHLKAYYERSDQRLAIERLESSLLQYRLLHKGFRRFYGNYNSAAKSYAEMDGDCPFYDDNYRRIATELYAKYVFIPSL